MLGLAVCSSQLLSEKTVHEPSPDATLMQLRTRLYGPMSIFPGEYKSWICLKNDFKKQGSILVYTPERNGLDRAAVPAKGKPGRVEIVARPLMGETAAV
jgi:hypothetical protein